MISKQIQEKGIFAKILEKAIEIILKRECKNIGKLKIDINASSIQIIKGIIEAINITAEKINYKDLLFDKIILEAKKVKISFKINNKELKFNNNLRINFKISFSGNSLKTILLSNKWNWIGDIISKEILNQNKLKDIKIKNNEIFVQEEIKGFCMNPQEKLNIKTKRGKIYLENKTNNKSITIPIEDKIYIKSININNDLIIIDAESTISF